MDPKPSYATVCTITAQFYKPTLVLATAKDQTINCKDYNTTTKFIKNFAIKGSSPSQFEVKTVNRKTWDICKDYPRQPKDSILVEFGGSDPQFDTDKEYLLSIFPAKDSNSSVVDLAPSCGGIVTQVNGPLDPKVIVNSIIVYIQPVLIIPLFLALYLSQFMSGISPLVLSGFIFLVLYGLVLYILIRFIKYTIRKIKDIFKPTTI
ncbi:hypothetical protein HYT74_00715 [Candidatus Daviesbacteria bacterium]|nr:hypothetical protein [Candidatus Daviesbacteria bacterium]